MQNLIILYVYLNPRWDIRNAKTSTTMNSKYILASYSQKHLILQQVACNCEKEKTCYLLVAEHTLS